MTSNQQNQQQIKKIESFLVCPYEQAQIASRWASKQSIDIQLWVADKSRKEYFNLKKQNTESDSTLLSIVASLISAFKAYNYYKKQHRKNKLFTPNDVILENLIEKNKFVEGKRVAKKEQFLTRKLPLLLKWLANGESYRSIALRLITIDGESISHEYIRQFIKHKRINNE